METKEKKENRAIPVHKGIRVIPGIIARSLRMME
jgi:hypothetical protein